MWEAIMKIILSRKGFDSANGGIVSPTMEDDTLLSFPIPSNDINTYDELVFNDCTYTQILKDLKYKGIDKPNCHIDPDLDCSRRKQIIQNWIPIFGQSDQAASYLLNNVKVAVGDVFLFFGNYHRVAKSDGKYKYIKGTNDFYKDKDLQVIWGYLQVGKIITDPKEQAKFSWHPHSSSKFTTKKTNVMFVAAERLSFDDNLSGAGLFSFSEDKVLTLKGCTKATWIKRDVYDVDAVIGERKNSAVDKNIGIYYAGIWQELALKENAKADEWVKSLFANSKI